MKRFFICFMLVASLLLQSVVFASEAQQTNDLEFHDACDNFALLYDRSQGISVATTDKYNNWSDLNGFTSNAGAEGESEQCIVYRMDRLIDGFVIDANFTSGSDGAFDFMVSSDGENYVTLPKDYNLPQKYATDEELADCVYERSYNYDRWVRYILYDLTGDYTFLKIRFNKKDKSTLVFDVRVQLREDKAAEEISPAELGGFYVPGPVDINGTEYEKSFKLLNAVGAADFSTDAAFNPESCITRGEFSEWLAKAAKISTKNAQTKYPALETLAVQGIISGDENGYAPEKNITGIQAVKIIMSILGYADYADEIGGYPTGYMIAANQAGLLKQISGDINAELKKGDAVIMLANMLNVKLMEVTMVDNGEPLREPKDITYLSDYYHITEYSGIVTANRKTDLVSEMSRTAEDNIKINGETYDVSLFNEGEKLLGYYVNYYVNDDGRIVYMTPDKNKNEVIRVYGYDVKPSTVKENLVYYENDKEKNCRISSVADLIYNGASCSFDEEILKSVNGYITLLDNTDDGIADVVFVDDYVSNVVTSVSTVNEIITSRYADCATLELKDKNVEIYQNGKSVTLADVKVGHVIAAAVSKGEGNNIKIIITNKRVSGLPKSVQKDSDGRTVVNISGVKYTLSKECQSAIDGGHLTDIKLGEKMELYIDAFGDVVYYISGGNKYGFVRKVTVSKNVFDTDVIFRIFTEDGVWSTIYANDDVKYNGDKTEKTELADKLLSEGEFCEAVRYKLSSEDMLIELETVGTNDFSNSNDTDAKEAAVKNDTFRIWETNKRTGFDYGKALLGQRTYLQPNTVVMTIPQETRMEEEELYGVNVYRTGLEGGRIYDFTSYDNTNFGETKFVIMRNYDRWTTSWITGGIITNLGEEVNRSLDLVHKIYACRGEKEEQYDISDASEYISLREKDVSALKTPSSFKTFETSDVEIGDIIVMVSGTDVVKLFSVDEFRNNPDLTFNMSNSEIYFGIEVGKFIDGNEKKICRFNINDEVSVYSLASATAYNLVEVSANGVNVYPASFEDMKTGDTIALIKSNTRNVSAVCIYRKV